MSDYVNKFHEQLDIISCVEDELSLLAKALSRVGNQQLAGDLMYQHCRLQDAREVLRELFADRLHSEFQQAQQSSANMLELVMHFAKKEDSNDDSTTTTAERPSGISEAG
jgi:hypothetical protein